MGGGHDVPSPTQGQTPHPASGQTSAPAGMIASSVPSGSKATTTLAPATAEAPQEPCTLTVTVISVKDVSPQGSHSASARHRSPTFSSVLEASSTRPTTLGALRATTTRSSASTLPLAPTFCLLTFMVSFQIVVDADSADKHILGKDTELGEAQVDIWRHIQPAIPTPDVFVELTGGSGHFKLRLDCSPGPSSAACRVSAAGPLV